MSRKRWMLRINAGIQNCDFYRTVWSGASVNLMSLRQVNLFRRPLGNKRSIVAPDAPDVAYAPDVSATDGWHDDEIWFNENNPRIIRQRVYTIIDRSVVCNSQPEDRPGAKLIDRSRIQ